MRHVLSALILGLLLVSSGAEGQLNNPRNQSFTLTASGADCSVVNACARMDTFGGGNITFQIKGPYTGTLVFEGRAYPSDTPFAVTAIPLGGGSTASSTTST